MRKAQMIKYAGGLWVEMIWLLASYGGTAHEYYDATARV